MTRLVIVVWLLLASTMPVRAAEDFIVEVTVPTQLGGLFFRFLASDMDADLRSWELGSYVVSIAEDAEFTTETDITHDRATRTISLHLVRIGDGDVTVSFGTASRPLADALCQSGRRAAQTFEGIVSRTDCDALLKPRLST